MLRSNCNTNATLTRRMMKILVALRAVKTPRLMVEGK